MVCVYVLAPLDIQQAIDILARLKYEAADYHVPVEFRKLADAVKYLEGLKKQELEKDK